MPEKRNFNPEKSDFLSQYSQLQRLLARKFQADLADLYSRDQFAEYYQNRFINPQLISWISGATPWMVWHEVLTIMC